MEYMPLCPCGIEERVFYFCNKESCPNRYKAYCIPCSEREPFIHDHGPITISKFNSNIKKDWQSIKHHVRQLLNIVE